MTHRVSTNATLLLKLFLPTFWTVFFGMFTLFVLFYTQSEILFLQNPMTKAVVLGVYTLFFALFYFTLWQLRRVELGETEYLVSDYFNTYRLIYDDINFISEASILKWTLVGIHLKGKGKLGRKIYFLANKDLYQRFFNQFPETQKLWASLLRP